MIQMLRPHWRRVERLVGVLMLLIAVTILVVSAGPGAAPGAGLSSPGTGARDGGPW
jgi:hypothetical protein